MAVKDKQAKKNIKGNKNKPNLNVEMDEFELGGGGGGKGAGNGKKRMANKKESQIAGSVERGRVFINKLISILGRFFTLKMYKNLIFNPFYFVIAACAFIVFEAFFNIYIIENVKYTEIDWKAYMQEVEGFLNGTLDYTELKGDTGPLVYPAGFVYIFSVLYYITSKGANVYLAQYVFAGFYILTLVLVFRIYEQSKKLPPYILIFICCMSYRIHSIYVLRLFNDPVAMLIFYGSLNCFISGWWSLGSVLYSVAVSVKMNILLYAPSLLMAYLYCLGVRGTAVQLFFCAAVQVLLGLPFLIANPLGYIVGSFDLGRVFLYEWTVNWRFLPEEIFVHPWFHIGLLVAHLLAICVFAYAHWSKYLVHYGSFQDSKMDVSCQLFLLPMFMCNLIGVAFSRSLHYQFYVWYFHTLPYLLWSTQLSIPTRLLLLGLIELCWNTFPSTWWSSSLLHICHSIILVALMSNRPSKEKVKSIRKKLLKGE